MRRRAILRDCFNAGLSQLTVIIGVLAHCDRSRLGFLPAYALQREEGHKPIYELRLRAEIDIGHVKRGDEVTFALDHWLAGHDYRIFGRCHQIYSCLLREPTVDVAKGTAEPSSLMEESPAPSQKTDGQGIEFIGKANLRKRVQSEDTVGHSRKREKRETKTPHSGDPAPSCTLPPHSGSGVFLHCK